MPTIVCIVEGHGDSPAIRAIIRRVADLEGLRVGLSTPDPIRIGRQRIIKPGELERAVELAARTGGEDGRILILLDADDDCPVVLATGLLERAKRARSDRRIGVVIAKSEFESWFIASALSLAGKRGLMNGLAAPSDPDSVRSPKAWLGRHMIQGATYRESVDQPALAELMDIEAASASRSFRKLRKVILELAA